VNHVNKTRWLELEFTDDTGGRVNITLFCETPEALLQSLTVKEAAKDGDELTNAYAEGRKDEAEQHVTVRATLKRLHDWALAQEGDCMFSANHPIAQAAAALAKDAS
jgi:hypothetical protein